MKAIILVAGSSTRTRPLTFTRPKPLLPFFDKVFLEYTLDQLVGLVDEVILAEYFLADMIQSRIGNSYKGMKIHHVVINGTPGTGGTVTKIREKFEPPFLVLNGDDIYSRSDIERLTKYDRAVLITDTVAQSRTLDGWSVDEEGNIQDMGAKPATGTWGVATGAYVLSQDYFDIAPVPIPGREEETGLPHTLAVNAARHNYKGIFVSDVWFPVGYAWDLMLLHEKFWPAQPQEVYIGENCTIDPSARVSKSVIGKNVTLGKNVVVENSVVMDGATIKDNTKITKSVIGANCTIGANVAIKTTREDGSTWHATVKGDDVDTGQTELGIFLGDSVVIEDNSTLHGGMLIDPPKEIIPQ